MRNRFMKVLPAKNAIKLPVPPEYEAFVQERIAYIFGDLIRGNKTLERALEDCYIQGMYDTQEVLYEKAPKSGLDGA